MIDAYAERGQPLYAYVTVGSGWQVWDLTNSTALCANSGEPLQFSSYAFAEAHVLSQASEKVWSPQ